MSNLNEYYKKKRLKKAQKLGLSSQEFFIAETALECLCFFNSSISPSYFDGRRSTKELFEGDRILFEKFFGALVKELDLFSVINPEDIPEGEEFERFPTFLDVTEFFYMKYKYNEKKH